MRGATHILATDLDGTLVGDKESLRQLIKFYEEQPYKVSLVYITGRHYASARTLIREENLPFPDVLVTDVGTEIRFGEEFSLDLEWQAKMADAWQPEAINLLAEKVDGLEKQQLPVTNRCSFYTASLQTVTDFDKRLKQAGLSYKLIYSGGRDVDILPSGSGKGKALEYLLDKYEAREAKLLVAGDSGNDLEMLTLGFPAVIVGNAQPELLESPENPMIYRASQNCAGGIHEAWNHFHS